NAGHIYRSRAGAPPVHVRRVTNRKDGAPAPKGLAVARAVSAAPGRPSARLATPKSLWKFSWSERLIVAQEATVRIRPQGPVFAPRRCEGRAPLPPRRVPAVARSAKAGAAKGKPLRLRGPAARIRSRRDRRAERSVVRALGSEAIKNVVAGA